MNGLLRSKQGCWTCRLRKKKCDETRPHCSTCQSLSITCYGFGAKPDWIGNSEKERAVAKNFKEIVKHTSRRKTKTQFSAQSGPTKIAPKGSNSSLEISLSSSEPSRPHSVRSALDHRSLQEDSVDMLQDRSTDSTAPEQSSHSIVGSTFSILADESVLLMHFLDKVFPLQYPLYKPGILEGGRGWLLALLLRTKPFYHAALALSAYHRRTSMSAKIGHSYQVSTLVQQEKHLEVCIRLVNKSAQNSCPNSGLGIVASILQLFFFELSSSHDNVCRAHLHAAMNIYQRGYKKNLTHLGLAERSRAILYEDLPPSEDEPMVTEEVMVFRFLGGTMIWLDIISSITAGTAPYLLPYHSCVLTSNSQIKLEDIMGCKNWVMLQIGRIAALHERKSQTLQQGNFNCTEYEQTAEDISKEIQYGLTQGALECFNISEHNCAIISNTMSDPPTLVTQLFIFMAHLYLHLVTHGFQNLELLETTVSAAVRMIQTQIPKHLLPTLVSPLYFIGSVVREDDKQFFRNIFSSPPLLDPFFKHRGRILPILEEIWSRRQTTPSTAWKDSFDLTRDILLL